jgi:hypothetical protein
VEGTIGVDVVKEAGNVEQYQGANALSFDTGLGVVNNPYSGINGTMVVPAAELVGVDETMGVGFVHDATGDDLLQELTAAF